MDNPPEPQKSTRRRHKIKTRIRRPEDPIAHMLHRRERRLEWIRKVRWWICILGGLAAIIWMCIWMWETTQKVLGQ